MKKSDISVEAEVITSANFRDEDYKDLTVWEGNREKKLTDFFDISASGKAEEASDVEIILMGDTTGTIKRIGEYMEAGKITVEGDIGMHCGNFMKGGVIEVLGDAGDFCGECLFGGEIIIHGSAGDMAGVDMKGGVLTIFGDCHCPCGNMTGGEVTIHGKVFAMPPAFSNEGE